MEQRSRLFCSLHSYSYIRIIDIINLFQIKLSFFSILIHKSKLLMSSSLVSSGEQCQQNAEINSLYFEIRSSENFGRYLVAKEDVAEKTLILSETPVVFGPSDEKDFETNVVSVYCISCCKLLHPLTAPQNDKQTNSYESLYNCCTNCGFPVCDKHCEKVSAAENF